MICITNDTNIVHAFHFCKVIVRLSMQETARIVQVFQEHCNNHARTTSIKCQCLLRTLQESKIFQPMILIVAKGGYFAQFKHQNNYSFSLHCMYAYSPFKSVYMVVPCTYMLWFLAHHVHALQLTVGTGKSSVGSASNSAKFMYM